MYADEDIPSGGVAEEESKEPAVQPQSSIFTEAEMDGYDFAGTDQQIMAPMLVCINQIMQSVVAAYSALKKIIKVDGQPGNELA